MSQVYNSFVAVTIFCILYYFIVGSTTL
uniref:Uncharacterized protein n=1 Tax=Arundo donax TaxID=35708 RepID=A0A0A8YM51_ARUDO